MNHDHYYVYKYGTVREWDVPLDEIVKKAVYAEDYIILLKHYDQLDEMRGLSLMYGVDLKVDTFTNWMECNRYIQLTRGTTPKRLPSVVFSNYRLPNIMGL